MARNKPDKPRVFCIGWHKTGTSTMGMALVGLGYTVLGARLDMAQSLLTGDLKTPLNEAGKFDAVQDVPWAALFKELDESYPGSKFILTIRDQDNWLESASNHFGYLDVDLHKWLYGEGILKGNEDLYLNRYQRHYQEVKDYFANRSTDLLIMDLKKGDGWEKLCEFLNEPIPAKKFPYLNKGKHNYNWREKGISRARNAVPWWLRALRVNILERLGLHKGRNRFNNMTENEEWSRKKH